MPVHGRLSPGLSARQRAAFASDRTTSVQGDAISARYAAKLGLSPAEAAAILAAPRPPVSEATAAFARQMAAAKARRGR